MWLLCEMERLALRGVVEIAVVCTVEESVGAGTLAGFVVGMGGSDCSWTLISGLRARPRRRKDDPSRFRSWSCLPRLRFRQRLPHCSEWSAPFYPRRCLCSSLGSAIPASLYSLVRLDWVPMDCSGTGRE